MQRAYDNIIHDVAIQKLNVVLCIDRAGIVGADGVTHQGLFDLAYLRIIPNLTIAAPRNEHELRNLMFTAQLPDMGPFAIRYPRGYGFSADWKNEFKKLEIGKGEMLKDGSEIAVISVGTMAYTVTKAIEIIENEKDIKIAHYDLRFVKPLDTEMLNEISKRFEKIIVVEDGVINGGAGSAILEFFAENNISPKIKLLGIPNCFVEHGSQAELYKKFGLDVEGIAREILSFYQRNS